MELTSRIARQLPRRRCSRHGRTVRGSHALPEVSLGPALSNRSMPCGRATPQPFLGVQPAAVFHPFEHRPPHAHEGNCVYNVSTAEFGGFEDAPDASGEFRDQGDNVKKLVLLINKN
jgi:hypothetical protein